MRPDMQEVLITPGRYGSRWKKNETVRKLRHKHVEEDEKGGNLSMRPKDYAWVNKVYHKGEHLTPLKRYLESKVGERWDDIYSEIRRVNSPDTAVGAHIYQHLWGFVERYPVYHDGRPCRARYGWRGMPDYLRDGQLYIDTSGRLAKVLPHPKITKAKRIILYKISSNTFAVQNKRGIWFLLKYSNCMKKEERVSKIVSHYEKNEEGRLSPVYVEKSYTYVSPYFKEVYLKRDDFELLPHIHPRPYSDYSGYKTNTGKQHWYLIEYKTMSKKEKQELGILA